MSTDSDTASNAHSASDSDAATAGGMRSSASNLPPVSARTARIAQLVFIMVALALAVGLIFLTVRHIRTIEATTQAAFIGAQEQALAAAAELDEVFGSAMTLTEALADDLSSGALPFDDAAIEARLSSLLDSRPDLDAITVAFAENAFPGDDRLHIISIYHDENDERITQIGESRYDYTLPPGDGPDEPQTRWYHDPLENGPMWQDPFLATGAGKMLIEYGAPFFVPDSDGEVAGVVAQDYSLEGVQQLVDDLALGQTGFGLLFSESGTWLAHPIAEYVGTRTFYESPQFMADPTLIDAAERALQGENVALERVEPEGQMAVWDFVTPVTAPGWALAVELSQTEFLLDVTIRLRQLAQILIVGGLLLAVLIALAVRANRPTKRGLWATSVAYSIIMTVVIVTIIALSRIYIAENGIAISNQSTLTGYLDNINREYIAGGNEPPIQIPTGVLMQAMRFPDSTSVVMNGYVWQRVPKIEGIEIAEGFNLPQLIDEPMQIEEIEREERVDETYIIWAVTATLWQNFDPVQYPFDYHDIKLRLTPTELQKNVLLTPDFAAYDLMAPGFRPGLDSTVKIRDWAIRGAAFRFADVLYNTTLGIPGRASRDLPELNYTISAQRRFLGPFIAFLLPALVAAMMIFAFLLSDRKPDEPEEIVTALSYTAALFFVIAVLHTALRESAAAIGLTYLEYFYLLLYLMIIFVAVNTFFIVHRPNYVTIRYGNNLISKLLFWPVVLTAMLVATVIIFV